MSDRRTYYIRRTRWEPCQFGDRVATCYHDPRCGPMMAAPVDRPGDAPFGRARTGWTRVRGGTQAGREAAAWRTAGWTTDTVRTSPQVLAEVREWQRHAKGYPGLA
jgi:hypothetical protein